MMNETLITVGVPVRNGEKYIGCALDIIGQQTYKNIEVIISDNASDDETSTICKAACKQYKNFKYVRQDTTLTALENFQYTVEQANGQYFMWAAADDRRDLNYIDTLFSGIRNLDDASLCFGQLANFTDTQKWKDAPTVSYDCATQLNENFYLQLMNSSYKKSGYAHIYGLIRTDFLKKYKWYDLEAGPDEALIFYLARCGHFKHVETTTFYRNKPLKAKKASDRAKNESNKSLKPFWNIRRGINAVKSGQHAEKEFHNRTIFFTLGFLCFLIGRIKTLIAKRFGK
jgi:glycosyltransferase involved in cell wall biosynthesis